MKLTLKIELLKIYDLLGIKSSRTKNITKHVFISAIYKSGTVFATLLLVPLTINYLKSETYGIWLTISSFVAWFSFFDIGIGHGLRNRFAEAKAIGDFRLVQAYVSTSFFSLLLIATALFFLFFFFNFFIDWVLIFNADESLASELNILMPIIFGLFCLRLIANLIVTIYTADQQHSMQVKVNFFANVAILIIIWLLSITVKSSLLILGVILSGVPVVMLTVLSVLSFNKRYKDFKPKLVFFNRKHFKDIFSLGFNFFIIQISGIIMFSTDNFIIAQIFGPKEVVPYNIAFKYFSIALIAVNMVFTPYWSSITEAITNNDFEWVKKSMGTLMKFSLVAILGVLLMLFFASDIYSVWVGDMVVIPFSYSLSMALYFIITIIYTPFTFFINGVGKIKIQMYSLLITAIINIPLSYFFAKNLNCGAIGVIIATILCIIPHTILTPIQYFKLINQRASGLWNR